MKQVLTFLKTLPGKVIFWAIVAVTMVVIILQFLGKAVTLKAEKMNLGALIADALEKFKIQQNKDKIKDLDKKPKKEDLETDPDKVVDFYKKRKK